MNITKFDKKCKCCPDFVAVRIIDNCDELKVGSIYLPASAQLNQRLAHCLVEDVGVTAKEKYGIEIGDYVLIDRLSTFAHTAPVALLKYENVILKTNKDKTEFFPLKNMVFIEPLEKDPITNVNGIYVPGYQEKLNLGTVTAINCIPETKIEVQVGDKVLLTKGGDVVFLGNQKIYIYKHDMLICKVLD